MTPAPMIQAPIMSKPTQLLTVSEVARRFKVSESTIRRMETDGRLKATRTRWGMRLFDADEVEKVATTLPR